MSVRQPAVAGMFYEAGPSALRREVESCFLAADGPGPVLAAASGQPRRIVGLCSPHAGFPYSGVAAAHAYHRLAEDGVPGIAVLLGPSHRPLGAAAAVAEDEAWRTPLGDIPVDLETARRLAAACKLALLDSRPHRLEHSLEVQLPFIQYIAEKAGTSVRIVPIVIGASAWEQKAADVIRDLGTAIAAVLDPAESVVIASTDLTHYESREAAQSKDSRAISRIVDLNEDGLLDVVRQLDISMCGVMPACACIVACKAMGAQSARRLAYRTSGDVTGDYTQVVGYAAIEIDR